MSIDSGTGRGSVHSFYLYSSHALGLHGEEGKLVVLLQSSEDFPEVDHIVWSNQKQRQAVAGGTGSSATAVDVGFRRPRNLNSKKEKKKKKLPTNS